MQRSKRIRPLDVEEQPSLGQSVSRNSIEGLLIILPFVCEYVQVYEQFNLAHGMNESLASGLVVIVASHQSVRQQQPVQEVIFCN